MTDDPELLRRYSENASEEAFAELVRRHINLVYSVALRKVGGDAHLAKDVGQSVFTDLARKAATLSRRVSLTGWLFTSTHFAASKAVRAAQRRRQHEADAHLLNELTSVNDPEPDWERLRPELDNLILALPDRDRDAVLLRFFEGRDYAQIGARLALSADGARSRVERALEKIRVSLARHGVTSTVAAVGVALTKQVGAVVPAGLAASITEAALAGGFASTGAATGILTFMSMNKLTIGIAGALAVGGAAGIYHQQQANSQLRVEMASLQQRQSQELTKLREDNQRLASAARDTEALRAEHAELVNLRSEVGALRQRTDATTRTPSAKSDAKLPIDGVEQKHPLAPGMLPVDSWGNVGHATPEASFQTQLWASVGGDVDMVAKSITFTPESRARAQAFFASLPENARAQYVSTERMAAFLLSSGTAFSGMQVLGQTVQGPDEVTLRTQWQYTDGRVRENDWQFHRDANGNWQRVIPAGLVDKWGTILRSSPTPAVAVERR